MKAVVADLYLWQSHANTLDVSGAHVLADMLDLIRVPTMRFEVNRKIDHRLVTPTRAGKQQAFGAEVMHHSEVTLHFM